MVSLVALHQFFHRRAGGFVDISESGWSLSRLGFRSYLLFGLLLGGAIFAVASGSFSLSFAYPDYGSIALASPVAQAVLLLIAGVVMGFGARTAGGCTSGHGMSGMSLFSPASLVATATFFTTAVALTYAFALLGGQS